MSLPENKPTSSSTALQRSAEQRSGERLAVGARKAALLNQLSREIDHIATTTRNLSGKESISSGCEAMDRLLPATGYVPGTVIEYLRYTPAAGASHLALLAAREAMKSSGGFLLVVDHLEQIYPPKFVALGIDLKKVIFVRPASDADAIWAVDQGLRTPAVAAVFAEIPRLDDQAARRLQLAAERGDGLGVLVRSATARKAPSWAEVQWIVRTIGRPRRSPMQSSGAPMSNDRFMQLRLARAKGALAGSGLTVRISGQTGAAVEYQPPAQSASFAAPQTGVA